MRYARLTAHLALAAAVVGLVWLATQGPVVSASPHSDRGCDSCHVPHNAYDEANFPGERSVPLWNPTRYDETLTYNYDSDGMLADDVGPIAGASMLCMSCHDGGVGPVDDIHLEDSHPVSFTYDTSLYTAAEGALVDPATLERGVLSVGPSGNRDQLQCTSCHEVHDGFAQAPYLRWTYTGEGQYSNPTSSDFCRNCHVK